MEITGNEWKIINHIVKYGCITCKNHDNLMARGIQICDSNSLEIRGEYIEFDLSGDDTWITEPILIWCEECQTIWLDRRKSVADDILNLKFQLDNGNVLTDNEMVDWKKKSESWKITEYLNNNFELE